VTLTRRLLPPTTWCLPAHLVSLAPHAPNAWLVRNRLDVAGMFSLVAVEENVARLLLHLHTPRSPKTRARLEILVRELTLALGANLYKTRPMQASAAGSPLRALLSTTPSVTTTKQVWWIQVSTTRSLALALSVLEPRVLTARARQIANGLPCKA
jgi:hypothetical protein